MEKKSKIFLAGHDGLVGSALFEGLKGRNFKNLIYRTFKDLDLRRQSQTEQFVSKEKPEYVFLAAAKVGGILANNTYKAEFIYDNIMIAGNVIHAAYLNNVKKLLNLGSSCIFPKLAKQPLKEEYLLTGSLEPTNEPYAIAKIAAIKLCRYHNEQYGTNFISVMPTNLFGYNDNYNLETAHVLPSLIRKFHLAKLLRDQNWEGILKDIETTPIGFRFDMIKDQKDTDKITEVLNKIGIFSDHVLIWGTGKPYREFLYSEDLADACIYLMKNCNYSEIGEFVNIGTGKEIQIRDLARLIQEIVGYEGAIKQDSSKPDGTPRKLLDVSRINSLGWEAKTPLREGIKKAYQAYLKKQRK